MITKTEKAIILNEKSVAKLYGEENLFSLKLSEGYKEVSFGTGQFVYSGRTKERVARFWAFYNPNGNISTREVSKFVTLPDPFPVRNVPSNNNYPKDEFEKYIKDKKIKLTNKMNLAELVKLN